MSYINQIDKNGSNIDIQDKRLPDIGSSAAGSIVSINSERTGFQYSQLPTISIARDFTLAKENWTGTATPYIQEVTVSGVTATNNIIIGFDKNSQESYEKEGTRCRVRCIGQSTNRLTFYAYNDKPTTRIDMTAIILG